MVSLSLEASSLDIYSEFERHCLLCKQAESDLLREQLSVFETASTRIHSALDYFYTDLQRVPLLSAVLMWAKSIVRDKLFGKRYLEIMRELVACQLLPIMKNDSLSSLEYYSSIPHEIIVNKIRSYSEWYLQKREDCVSLYITFANWLSEATLSYIEQAHDSDRLMTSKRQLTFEKYIELLTLLPVRERIIVKLFYLGGARSLDDILALKISNIDFERGRINFSSHSIQYPLHVIDDIKTHLGRRKKGFVFANTLSTDRIHHTVPYRLLKKAAQKIGLPESFSYKNLVEDI